MDKEKTGFKEEPICVWQETCISYVHHLCREEKLYETCSVRVPTNIEEENEEEE